MRGGGGPSRLGGYNLWNPRLGIAVVPAVPHKRQGAGLEPSGVEPESDALPHAVSRIVDTITAPFNACCPGCASPGFAQETVSNPSKSITSR